MHPRRWTPLILTVLAACGGGFEPEPPTVTELPGGGVELELSLGQRARALGGFAQVRFDGVLEDSRCPTGATCVWEGNFAARLLILVNGAQPFPVELNTAIEPMGAVWNGQRISLEGVSPERVSEEPIPGERYRIRVRVVSDG